MRIGKILVVIVALMLISIGATAQDSRDPWISNDVARVNIMANLPWASVGLHFGMAAILGCDGDLSLGDYMTMTSILELSAAPLYTYDPTDAWYGSFATSTLLAAEGYAADRFGTDSFAAGYLHWTRVSLAEYRAYEAYARTRLDSHSYSNSGFTRHRLVDLYRAPINPAVLRDLSLIHI